MSRSVRKAVPLLLKKFEEASKLPCSVIAFDMEIPPSNYYLYRDGRGNPTCKTLDKMIEIVRVQHPEILEDWLLLQLEELRAEIKQKHSIKNS